MKVNFPEGALYDLHKRILHFIEEADDHLNKIIEQCDSSHKYDDFGYMYFYEYPAIDCTFNLAEIQIPELQECIDDENRKIQEQQN